jgi:hypothetical protein
MGNRARDRLPGHRNAQSKHLRVAGADTVRGLLSVSVANYCDVFHTCAALHHVSGNLVQPFAKNFAQFVIRITEPVR